MAEKNETNEQADQGAARPGAPAEAEAASATEAAETAAEAPEATAATAVEEEPTDHGATRRGGRAGRKSRVGVVVSDVQNKTVVVEVARQFAHPLYGKQVARHKRYPAHDENDEYRTGDKVRIVETRPMSKTKRWRVSELIERPE